MRTIFDRYLEEIRKLKPQTDLFGKAGKEQLLQIPLSEIDREIVDRECHLIDKLNNLYKGIGEYYSDISQRQCRNKAINNRSRYWKIYCLVMSGRN